jgi:hypothetical protein
MIQFGEQEGGLVPLKKASVPMTLLADRVIDLDDLDLTQCVAGPDFVVHVDGIVTLYRREGRSVELFGVFDGPASALAALDAFDAPGGRDHTQD